MAKASERPIPYPKIMQGVNGLLSRREANFLYNTPARIGNGLYADLGTHYGRSAICMAGGIQDNNVEGHVITVDSYDGRGMSVKRVGQPYQPRLGPKNLTTVNATLEEKGVRSLVTAVHGLTAEVAEDYQDKEFVFVFIDADHSYEGCKADFEAWGPLLKRGGEMAFHDTNKNEVDRVLRESCWDRYYLRRLGSIGVIKKP